MSTTRKTSRFALLAMGVVAVAMLSGAGGNVPIRRALTSSHGSLSKSFRANSSASNAAAVDTACTMPSDQWWDFNADSLSLADGADVTSWPNDGSFGSGVDLTASGTAAPQFDTSDPQLGIKTVTFASADAEIMRSPTLANQTGPFSVCYVWKLSDPAKTQVVFDGRSNSYRISETTVTGSSKWFAYAYENAGGWKMFDYLWPDVDNVEVGTASGTNRWNYACYRLKTNDNAAFANGFPTTETTLAQNDITGFAIGGRTLGASFIDGAVARISVWNRALSDAELKSYATCYAETIIGQACTFPAGSPCTDGRPCKVAIVGDSIDAVSSTASYPTRGWYGKEWRTDIGEGTASSKAHCLYLDTYGVGGYTTSQIDTQVVNKVIGNNYDLVVYGGGINDIGSAIPQATIKANYRTTWDRIIADGAVVWFREVLPYSAYSDANIEDLNTYAASQSDIHILKDGSGTRLHDVAESSPGSNTLKTAWDSGDGLHPNSTGANDIAGYLTAQVGPS